MLDAVKGIKEEINTLHMTIICFDNKIELISGEVNKLISTKENMEEIRKKQEEL